MNERVYQFGDVRVDSGRFQVLKAGAPLELEPKAIEVLLFLIERRERLVLKEELLDGVWRDTFVTPNALTRVIAQLRKALGDDAQEAHVIETVPRKGYRFLPEVTFASSPAVPADVQPPATLRPRAATSSTPTVWRATLPLLAGAFLALTGWSWLRPTPAAPLALTELVQLTSGIGFEADPSISADGRRIAYTAEEKGFNEIYVRPVGDGNRIQVTTDGGQNVESVWSPDGETIAYHSRAKGGIWIVPASGGSSKQVATLGSEPAWSPDGSRLAFSTYQGALAERATIMTVQVAGGPAQVGHAPGGAEGRASKPCVVPRWPPRRVLRLRRRSGRSVWIVAATGGEPTRVGAGTMPDRLAFTPDGSALCWSGWARQRTSGSGA